MTIQLLSLLQAFVFHMKVQWLILELAETSGLIGREMTDTKFRGMKDNNNSFAVYKHLYPVHLFFLPRELLLWHYESLENFVFKCDFLVISWFRVFPLPLSFSLTGTHESLSHFLKLSPNYDYSEHGP